MKKIIQIFEAILPIIVVMAIIGLFYLPFRALGKEKEKNDNNLLEISKVLETCPNCGKEFTHWESDELVLIHMKDRCSKPLEH